MQGMQYAFVVSVYEQHIETGERVFLPRAVSLSLCCRLSASELWMESRVEGHLRRN